MILRRKWTKIGWAGYGYQKKRMTIGYGYKTNKKRN